MRKFLVGLLLLTVGIVGEQCTAHHKAQAAELSPSQATMRFAAYHSRFARARPVVAVIGENTFTELTDYVIPYAVLAEADVAEVLALATRPGPLQMFPALKLEPQVTSAEFDARFPEGADYVIVPAVHYTKDPTLLAWVTAQAAKGATIIGVCDGVWVLAHAGLLQGRQATGYWYSLTSLEKQFPETTWMKNQRYVVDQNIVTTTGVTASIPVSLALVEAIAGRAQAESVARSLGIADWSTVHQSDIFHLDAKQIVTAVRNWLSFWSHETVGIPVTPGVDEIALALVADAYSRTYLSSVVSVSPLQEPLRTKRGLLLLPDRVANTARAADRMLALAETSFSLDHALEDIAQSYGRDTAAFVALQLEYPEIQNFTP